MVHTDACQNVSCRKSGLLCGHHDWLGIHPDFNSCCLVNSLKALYVPFWVAMSPLINARKIILVNWKVNVSTKGKVVKWIEEVVAKVVLESRAKLGIC